VIALITDVPASAHAQLRGPAVVAVLDALSFASQDIVSGRHDLKLDPSMRYDAQLWVMVARIVATSATTL